MQINNHLFKAGLPEAMREPRTTPEIALGEIDRLIAAGLRFGVVLSVAGYGLTAEFRQGLSARDLVWAVGIPKHRKIYAHDVALIFPVSGHGRLRQYPIPDIPPVAVETTLAAALIRSTVCGRRVTKGRLPARFAAKRIPIADGPPQRILDKGSRSTAICSVFISLRVFGAAGYGL